MRIVLGSPRNIGEVALCELLFRGDPGTSNALGIEKDVTRQFTIHTEAAFGSFVSHRKPTAGFRRINC
jgi:hypothetical protein